jgi:thiamine biosynthesis protein ThiS
MTVTVNGKPRPLEPGATVAELLDGLAISREGVAVAVNRRIIPRSGLHERALSDGDVVEIVRAVGGG